MDLYIRDEEAALSTCQQIANYNKQISSQIETLESALKSINAAWESTGLDKESYVLELERQIQNLKITEMASNELTNGLIEFINENKRISSSTM